MYRDCFCESESARTTSQWGSDDEFGALGGLMSDCEGDIFISWG